MRNIIEDKSFNFSVRIVKLCNYVRKVKRDQVLTNQLLRAGTSVGANVAEAEQAHSHADFIAKMTIALKEASESEYWLRLMEATGYLSREQAESILTDCREIQRILTAIVKNARGNI